jgi:hypothetical protein
MLQRSSIGVTATRIGAHSPSKTGVNALMLPMLMLAMALGSARAADEGKYPTNWKGEWTRVVHREVEVQGAFDQTKPWGLGQDAPLTAEYQKVLKESMDDQRNGGLGNYPTSRCLPSGLPRMMTFGRQEYVVTPDTTYILLSGSDHLRRVFTDGRDWPKNPQPTYGGYTIGRWVDETGQGRYDTLVTETRFFKGPRAFDASGLPLAFDNQSIFAEKFFLDRKNPDIMHVLTTVSDHALTRPWTSDRQYQRVAVNVEQWPETWCQEGNANIVIGKENYFIRADGVLMPAKPNQTPPDLRYFQQAGK